MRLHLAPARYDTTMRFGILGLNSFAAAEPSVSLELAQLAERLGYESVWAGEHVILPSPKTAVGSMEPSDPIHDPLVWLAFVASATREIKLGTGVIVLPQRNPVVLAKQTASLDVLSGGRLILGLGAGHLEQELNAVGIPLSERGARMDEHLDVLRALWTMAAPISFAGRYTSFSGMDAHPKPVQRGGPAVVIGGHSIAAHRRAAMRGHGWYGFKLLPEAVTAPMASLRRAVSELGRPEALGPLEISIAPPADIDSAQVRAYRAAGVDRLILYPRGDAESIAASIHRHAALLDG